MYKAGLFAGIVFACVASAAHADFTQNTSVYPDITVFFVTTNYDASQDLFTATADGIMAFNSGSGPAEGILNGSFSIVATIDDTGTATDGTLTVLGELGPLGPSLLTGHLIDFNTHAGDGFNFLFKITGGDLHSTYGSNVVVILNGGGSGFAGLWTSDFGVSVAGAADILKVPSPSSALLALIGGSIVGLVRRRKAA